jgi:hypothetical protein
MLIVVVVVEVELPVVVLLVLLVVLLTWLVLRLKEGVAPKTRWLDKKIPI